MRNLSEEQTELEAFTLRTDRIEEDHRTGRNTGRRRDRTSSRRDKKASVIMRGDNLPIADLTKYNTDGKEAKYIQINHHIVGKLTTNKKTTEDHIKASHQSSQRRKTNRKQKKATKIKSFEFMMDLKTLNSRTAINLELTRVRNSKSQYRRRRYRAATERFSPYSQSDGASDSSTTRSHSDRS